MIYDQAMLSALKNADNFMICAHINPDGDAIGSMLASGRLLRRLGKNVTMVSPNEVPENLKWLPDAELIRPVEALEGKKLDAALCVDASEPKRMGSAYAYYERAPLRFVIDHHPGTADFARYAVVEPGCPAAGEMIFALWEEMGQQIDREAALQLYAAISTDTGNFCFDSVRPDTFACMEKLMRLGLDLSEASRRLFLVRSKAGVMALSKVLGSMKFFADGQATCTHLTAADKAECQCSDGDLHGMVNYGLNIDGVKMTFMADETPDGWKISLRALPGGDAASIARQFGGGGHTLAAGCVLQGGYAEIESRLMQAVQAALTA
ncbi:MAG: bifunctional oligoribonuclease/PAP phosphatase NrnA [Clostridia bacterium]|nr:bifunctional oligoribonuclease/PAP phosphatase NrnA [Clostridia bacterium]